MEWENIVLVVLAANALLKAITDVTKNKKDDNIAKKIGWIIAYIFGQRTNPK